MAQQTAVEWLIMQLPVSIRVELYEKNIHKQAKQMEKEQIIDAHIEGQRVFDKHPHTQWTNDKAEKYYNETYEK
jgi:hypothetical protein